MMMARLRRGVSLEVIVEEEDDNDVTISPSPLTSDGESNVSDSNSSSPTPCGSEDNKVTKKKSKSHSSWPYGGDGGTSLWGLDRTRSVSCEALTVLDASDLETCEAEWNEGSDDGGLGRPVCVTFSGPISRRKILKARQALHEDAHQRVFIDNPEDDLYYQETLALYDNVQNIREQQQIEEKEPKPEEDSPDTDIETHFKESWNLNDDIIPLVPSIVIEEPPEAGEVSSDALEDDEDNDSGVQSPSSTSLSRQTKIDTLAHPSLQNVNIDIIESSRTPLVQDQNDNIELDNLEQKKKEAYTIRNKEMHLEELPAPHTVSLVKRLFEDLSSRTNYQTYKSTGRFREIRSNPSSKILRFDRHQQVDTNQTLCKIDQLLQTEKKKKVPSILKSTTHNPPSAVVSNGTAVPREEENETIINRDSNINDFYSSSSKKVYDICINTKSAQKTDQQIPLRKPKVVSGFNVRKALQENPRYFHIISQDPSKQPTKTNSKKSPTITNTNYQKFNKLQREVNNRDKEDVESLSSDTSEDSGVSNESSSSSSLSPPFRLTTPYKNHSYDHKDEDTSFKWIDPAVLARIRAVGTTVIFFGPRQKNKQGLNCTAPPTKTLKTAREVPQVRRAEQVIPIQMLRQIPKAKPRSGGMAVKWRGGGDNTVVYNFTKYQPMTSPPTHLPEMI